MPTSNESACTHGLMSMLTKRLFLLPNGAEAAEWALATLETRDTVGLRILAGMGEPWDEGEVDRYLDRALSELGLERPPPDVLARAYARRFAEDIISGRVGPLDGARNLYEFWQALRMSPEFLEQWNGIDDAISLAQSGIGTLSEVEEDIRAEANRLLADEPSAD